MALGQQQNNTMAEGVRKILNILTDMKLMSDADLPQIIKWETEMIEYLRPPTPQSQQMAASPGGPSPDMAMMGPAMGQVMGAGAPNMDEMRRMTGG